MMKKLYLTPELTLVSVASADVLTASPSDDYQNDVFDGKTLFMK